MRSQPTRAISRSSRGGNGVARIQPRIRAPASASARDVFDVEGGQLVRDALGRGRRARGNRDTPGRSWRSRRARVTPGFAQVADHLAERGVLAADGLDVVTAEPRERELCTVTREASCWRAALLMVARRARYAVQTRPRDGARRTVFFVSDQTGVTAETMGHSLLTQFDGLEFRQVTLPFISTVDKAEEAVAQDQSRPPRRRACGRSCSARWCEDDMREIVMSAQRPVPRFLRRVSRPARAGART